MDYNNFETDNSLKQIGVSQMSSKEAMGLIISRAQQLVNKLIETRKHDKPPFLPQEYFHLVNIKHIEKTDLGSTSGLLLKLADGYLVKVNDKQYDVRQNFSCAHEIGHILFDDLELDNYVSNIEYRRFDISKTSAMRMKAKETLCDAVAAELLMPELIFRKYLDIFPLSITTIEHMASVFRVSIQSAARRIVEVSVNPCIVTIWLPSPKYKPKGLRGVEIPNIRTNYILSSKFAALHSSLYKAYENDVIVKTRKVFYSGTNKVRLPIEAKGFGRGESRFLISLAFPSK